MELEELDIYIEDLGEAGQMDIDNSFHVHYFVLAVSALALGKGAMYRKGVGFLEVVLKLQELINQHKEKTEIPLEPITCDECGTEVHAVDSDGYCEPCAFDFREMYTYEGGW